MAVFQETTYNDEQNCINDALNDNWTIFSIDLIDNMDPIASVTTEKCKYKECIRANPHSEIKTCRHIIKTDTSYHESMCVMYRFVKNELDVLNCAIDILEKNIGYDYVKDQLYSLLNLKQLRLENKSNEISVLETTIGLLENNMNNDVAIQIVRNLIYDITYGR